jgi:6-pyruvoyl-tetrahydropterin synthase
VRLKIRHNMEMAHRLSLDTGKCKQIHGHGMQVELVLLVSEGETGMAVDGHGQVFEFGDMKRKFRNHIDSTYDHRLVLNEEDSWAQPIYQIAEVQSYMTMKEMVAGDGPEEVMKAKLTNDQKFLPGLSLVPGDPTVENLAKWIAEWACSTFHVDVICRIDETRTNGAEAMYQYRGSLGPKFAEGAR